jgi:Domain of unknown function (DUF4136)
MRSSLRSALPIAVAAMLALESASCGGGVNVTTTAAPDADFRQLRTFRVLDAPHRRADAPALSASDPMLDNSITNRRLRADLVQGLTQRGYVADSATPDFLVAYYAGTRAKMDTTYWIADPGWRYGYRGFGFRGPRFRSAWPWYGFASPYPEMQVRDYTQGSVIVDVIDPKTMELLWRGQGVATVSDDPMTYAKDLNETVVAILKQFPQSGG